MKKLKFLSPILLPIFAIISILTTGCSNSVAIAQNTRLEDMMKTFYTKEEKKSVKDQIKSDAQEISMLSNRLYSATVSELSNLLAEISDLKCLYHEYGIESKTLLKNLNAVSGNLELCIEFIETMQAIQKGDHVPGRFIFYPETMLPHNN